MQNIIEVNNISKQYRLGTVGTGSLHHDINRWFHKIRGKEDPYLKIGEANDRRTKGDSDYVWALKDISFTVEPGEVLGIIGRNGAGKSTLLKILSRITAPTTGSIALRGRVASLLEVGTGMHPELTGRENIYLNGSILGMRKKEIDRKLDAIVDFSGVERYLDTPVKRYSSGMHVRLGFAVAAHLEPDILIVDEVLAVGDAEFQKKCLGKMKDISNEQGRTVLFVSHNMASVKALCKSCLVLINGMVGFTGSTEESVSKYLTGNSNEKGILPKTYLVYENEYIIITEIRIKTAEAILGLAFEDDDVIQIYVDVFIKQISEKLHMTFVLTNDAGEHLFAFTHASNNIKLKNGRNKLICTLPGGFLNVGSYFLSVYIIKDARYTVLVEKDILNFTIQPKQKKIGEWMGREPGFIKPIFDWCIE